MAVITISREYGSAGDKIAKEIATRLGYQLVDKELIEEVLIKYGLLEFDEIYGSEHGIWERFDSEKNRIVDMLDKTIMTFAFRDNCVILGRGAFAVLQDYSNVVNVLVRENKSNRIINVLKGENIEDIDVAEEKVEQHDRVRRGFLQTFYSLKSDDPSMFDLCINTGLANVNTVVDMLAELVKSAERRADTANATTSIDVDSILKSAIEEVLQEWT